MVPTHEIEIRVRYQETDGQGHVHHGSYIGYFELGRTEQLRAAGRDYHQLEAQGVHLVVSEMSLRYFQPCKFGEVITLKTETVRAKGARIHHHYLITRDGSKIAEGQSTVACVDASGKVRRLPDWMLTERKDNSSDADRDPNT